MSVKEALDFIGKGINGQPFENVHRILTSVDYYMSAADYKDYCNAQKLASELYSDTLKWNKMSLVNIAESGRFAADRSIKDYAENIWHIKPVE